MIRWIKTRSVKDKSAKENNSVGKCDLIFEKIDWWQTVKKSYFPEMHLVKISPGYFQIIENNDKDHYTKSWCETVVIGKIERESLRINIKGYRLAILLLIEEII